MSKRMSRRGQITIPTSVREQLQLTPGDEVDFEVNAAGEVVMRKSSPTAPAPRYQTEQLRRRAAELRSLLRGLD
jgi:AbrB family looped-hinge helix DNA binding protein